MLDAWTNEKKKNGTHNRIEMIESIRMQLCMLANIECESVKLIFRMGYYRIDGEQFEIGSEASAQKAGN